ncbi:MAG TPA: VOC family protein [Rhizomicrobium sp.]|nr:VOC family protein [Rhizomicrobium sp.]
MTDTPIATIGLSHISIRVRDVARSKAWYQAALGFEVLTEGPAPTPDRTYSAMGLLCDGRLALELLQSPDGHAADIKTFGIVGLSLTVPDIEVAASQAQAKGLDPTPVIEAGDWKVVFLRDPDGNVVEFVMQPPGATSIADFAPVLRARRLNASS